MLALAQEEPLKDLEWLIGEWEGKAQYGQFQVTSHFRYEWAMNRKFIQWKHQSKDGKNVVNESTGFLGWDRDEKKFAEFGFGTDGTIGWGKAAPSVKSSWTFEGRLSTDAPFKEVRKTIARAGDDKYTETVEGKIDGKWTQVFQAEYARKK
jgi:hypothetical protein